MAKLLRHTGTLDAYGYMTITAVVNALNTHKGCENTTEAAVRTAATPENKNDKSRFVIEGDKIRAAQGHSILLAAPILTPVDSMQALRELLAATTLPEGSVVLPVPVHRTTPEAFASIEADKFVHAGTRTHVHFALLQGHQRTAKGGAFSKELLLDLDAAIAAGCKAFVSTNNVLLLEGRVPTSCVSHRDVDSP